MRESEEMKKLDLMQDPISTQDLLTLSNFALGESSVPMISK